MRKLFLFTACLIGIGAMAQADEINAVSATQGTTTDWFSFDNTNRIHVNINDLGDLEFPNDRTYDLTDGVVETEFGTAPAEKITLTAADFTVTKDGDWKYDQTEKRVKVEISEEYIMPESFNIDIYYNNDKMVKPIDPGTYQVYIDIRETDIYAAVTGITSEDWKFDIIDPKGAIQKIEEVAADAVAAIDEAAGEYASLQAIWEIISSKKEEIVSRKGEASHFIGDATDMEEISQQKEEAIQHIENIKSSAVEKIQEAIADYKQKTIVEIKDVASTAKEEIDGFDIEASVMSKAKADIDNIVNTAQQTINAATFKDAIDNAKTQAIADIHNVVQTTKDMWVIVRENMTIGNYGTLCWNYNLTDIDGAELYTIAGIENDSIILKEVLAEETEAGAGYVILATAETLRVKNGLEYVQDPVPAESNNGLQGTFADIVDGAAGTAGNILEGNYIVYNNEWRKCGVYTGLLSNRAYLVKDKVPNVIITQAPGRKYASMELPDETQTELNNVIADSDAITDIDKYFYKGQVIIRKGDKSFNIQGIEILPIE